MPELPEVETVRRSLLAAGVSERRIGRVKVRDARLRFGVNVQALERTLPGRRILGIRRRGKYLLFDLEGELILLMHLGMSGRIGLFPAGRRPRPHDHVLLRLDAGLELRFNDARRFGMIQLLDAAAESEHPRLKHLGVEPLGDAFTARGMRTRARHRRVAVKSFLMNASEIVGVGNIYACEALHAAGIHPARPAGGLSIVRWTRLTRAVRRVLRQAIRRGGTTLRDFADARGEVGLFALDLAVYGRQTEPCRRCGRPVRRIVQAGRSTFYCPGCQH